MNPPTNMTTTTTADTTNTTTKTATTTTMTMTTIKDISELHAAVGAENLVAVARGQCVPWVDEAEQRMAELLAPRGFSAANPPPPERVIYRIGAATIAT